MIVFIGALRHPLNANDYTRVEQMLWATLRSVCQQSDREFRVIVVCNQTPDHDALAPSDLTQLTDIVEFVEVDFPPPSTLAAACTGMAAIRRDRGTKYIRGVLAAQKHKPDYLMIFDADDVVSPEIAAFVNQRPGRPGWRVERGYVHDLQGGHTWLLRCFDSLCGTSLIINNELLVHPVARGVREILTLSGERLPIDLARTDFCSALGEQPDQDEILAAVDEVFLEYVLGSHKWTAEYFGLESLPFTGAIWMLNTGENHGGYRRFSDDDPRVLAPCTPPPWLSPTAAADYAPSSTTSVNTPDPKRVPAGTFPVHGGTQPPLLGGGYRRVFHYHVRKTAGTSLNAAFWRLAGLDFFAMGNLLRVSKDGMVFVRFDREMIESGDYLYANSHDPAESFVLPEGTFTVTVLRDPVSRIVSLYRYLLFLRDHPAAGLVEPALRSPSIASQVDCLGADFAEFLSRIPRQHLQSHLYTFSRELNVEQAAVRILACSQVCFTETFSDDLARMARRLDLPLIEQHERRFGATVKLRQQELQQAREMLEPEYDLMDRVSRALDRPLHHARHEKIAHCSCGETTTPALVVVLGLFRSGSSCLAGALHHLGISMGSHFHNPGSATPRGSYEDMGLQYICQRAYEEPSTERRLAGPSIVARLRRWLEHRRRELPHPSTPVGAKHPLLCDMVPELCGVAPDARLIRIERPLDQSIRSLQHVDWWPSERAETLQRFLDRRVDQALATRPHIRVSFQSLLEDPRRELARIATALELPADPERLEAAARFVDPSLKHF